MVCELSPLLPFKVINDLCILGAGQTAAMTDDKDDGSGPPTPPFNMRSNLSTEPPSRAPRRIENLAQTLTPKNNTSKKEMEAASKQFESVEAEEKKNSKKSFEQETGWTTEGSIRSLLGYQRRRQPRWEKGSSRCNLFKWVSCENLETALRSK